MKRNIGRCSIVIVIVAVLLSAQPCSAETHEDLVTIDQYIVGNFFWAHHTPAGFTSDTVEIELYISVWTFNDYGVIDLFCSNSTSFDYGNVFIAPSKPGFIKRITRSDAPNSSAFYTITATLKVNQVDWLNDDGEIYIGLIGNQYQFPIGWPAQYDLDYSRLTATGLPPDICECDLETDGDCDMSDYLLFGEDWGRTDCGTPAGSGLPPNDCECDLDHDGDCDMSDYFLFGDDWGRTDCPIQ